MKLPQNLSDELYQLIASNMSNESIDAFGYKSYIEEIHAIIVDHYNNLSTKEETTVINKKEAMSNFFDMYAGDIEGRINTMSQDELYGYLENDIFIACASSATGISEQEFIDFAISYFRRDNK